MRAPQPAGLLTVSVHATVSQSSACLPIRRDLAGLLMTCLLSLSFTIVS